MRIIAVSRAPLDKLLAYKARVGWRFEWMSSQGEDFNRDFRVSFTEDEITKGRVDYNFRDLPHSPPSITRPESRPARCCSSSRGEVHSAPSW